ncbi:MAG TPA: xanthine dehydrogenase family protein subunit M [Hyphomicrobiaceae bacterium]|nr:xanthine dehydrogenase family protein subunit M [Hyphomicrobiaceae bacterium]
MYAFDYHRPNSVAEAARLLAGAPESKLLAGGHTLLPTMKLRLAGPKTIIDLGRVAELRGIERTGNDLVIGAMETHDAVASSPQVKSAIAGLAELAAHIGDQHVRHRGTIGGSVANNDPAADYPAAVLALNATITTNKRTIKADDFFKGLFATALADDEIITRLSFPVPAKFAYAKFANPASRYALVGVGVADTAAGVRVAVTGASSAGVYRASAMEAALAKGWSAQSLAGLAGDPGAMMSDIHADAQYRAHLVGVMARRAVARSSA